MTAKIENITRAAAGVKAESAGLSRETGQGELVGQEIEKICQITAKRFRQLSGDSLEIAVEGITRYLRACRRLDVPLEARPIQEIIEDSLSGRAYFREVNNDRIMMSKI